jgi:release factor glutamine methyltransferase
VTGRTLGEALRQASARIGAVDARALLCHAAGRDRASLIAHPEAVLAPGEALAFDTLVDRRGAGEPVAYLTGEREFYGLSFKVTPDVLIPRPETELLVDLALERAPHEGRVLDLGAGSGCIGLTLVSQRSHLRVGLADQSLAALAVARENARRLGVDAEFLRSDWYSALGHARFDVIVSNPPYVADGDPHLGAGDLRFEPPAALVGGPDGFDCIRRIVAGGPAHLAPGGWLLIEHGYDQASAVRALLAGAGFAGVFSARDLSGIERVSGGRLTVPARHP